MQITLQQLWTGIIPVIAWLASYLIQQEHWSSQINGIIAAIIVILSVSASLLLQGGNITDASVVAAFSTALQSEALAPLMPYLRAAPSLPGSPTTAPQIVRVLTPPPPPSVPPASQPPA